MGHPRYGELEKIRGRASDRAVSKKNLSLNSRIWRLFLTSLFAFIGGGTVDRGNSFVVQPQINRQLSAMMRHVVENAVTHRLITSLLAHQLARGEHAPFGLQQTIV